MNKSTESTLNLGTIQTKNSLATVTTGQSSSASSPFFKRVFKPKSRAKFLVRMLSWRGLGWQRPAFALTAFGFVGLTVYTIAITYA